MSEPIHRGKDAKGRDVWQLSVSLGVRDSQGKYPRHYETFHGTITLARRRLTKLHSLRDQGKLGALTTTDTVADALDSWFAALPESRYSLATLTRYRSILDNTLP